MDFVDSLSSRQFNRAVKATAEAVMIDIRVVQVLLGHQKLWTTALFTQEATDIVREVVSPIETLPPMWVNKPMARLVLDDAYIFGGHGHGPAWRQAQHGRLSLGQLKAMFAIERCLTATLGGHLPCCPAYVRKPLSN